MSNKLKKRVEKILEQKNNRYQRKYFVLSKIAETDIFKSPLYETFNCYVNSLNVSNGEFPSQDALIGLYEKELKLEAVCKPAIDICKTKLLKEMNLYYSTNMTSNNDVIESLLENISLNDKRIDKQLSSVILESCKRKKRILSESSYEEGNIIDLTKFFGEMPAPTSQDLIDIEDEELEDQEFEDTDESLENDMSASKIDKTVDKIISIFSFVGGDPKKMSKKDLASKLGFKGNGRYVKGQKVPVLSGWDKIELEIGKMLSPYGRSKGMSTVAQRKWWIIQCIKFCLLIEKQQGYFVGLSSDVKSRMALSDDEIDAVSSAANERLRSGQPLSQQEINQIISKLQQELIKGDYDLESSLISEDDLFRVLFLASSRRGHKIKHFKNDLDIMYPLHDTRSEVERVEQLSDEESELSRRETASEFERREREMQDLYGDEIDPETGEPLYADEETIRNINKNKIDIAKASKEKLNEPVKQMTINNYIEYMKEINQALARLRELDDKIALKKPDIFKKFDQDEIGNINYNGVSEIDVPVGALTQEEIKEYERLVAKLAGRTNIEMMNLDRRGIIYDELYERGATPEEFMSFMKTFNLSDDSKPQKYRDISRSSYGQFRDAAGSRQYALKSWFKANYFSLNPKEKAEIYAQLGEKWYERLTVLDLITDKSFSIQSNAKADKVSPKLSNYFDDLPSYLTPKIIERYFNVGEDESLDTHVQEKIHQVLTFTDSEEDFKTAMKALQDSDQKVKRYAILDSLFEGTSAFRIFATTMLKEFYNKNVWSTLESDLAYAVAEYFKKYYPNAGIGASLERGEKSKDVPREEGRDLFNPIIYLAMSRVGLPNEESYSVKGNDLESTQRQYFLGDSSSKGDFAKKVHEYNASLKTGGLYSRGSLPGDNRMFNRNDVNFLLDDIFNPNGIIGRVRDNMRQLTKSVSNDFFTFLSDYNESKLDQIIINAMAMSNIIRRGADPLNVEIFNAVAKDTQAALDKYKKEFAKQLTNKDFVEYLGDEFGYEPVDLKSQSSSKGIPSEMM